MNDEKTINDTNFLGDIKISDDVVATITGLATSEVEGVYSMAGTTPEEIVGKLGFKNMSKNLKIEMNDSTVLADVYIVIKYGYSIPETARQVQDKVKFSIEDMTGLEVTEVNVHVVGINVD